MSIVKQPKAGGVRRPTPEEFISGAPDARGAAAQAAPESVASSKNGTIRGKRKMSTIGFQSGLLERATLAAERVGISRAAWINMIVKKALEEAGV